MRGAQPAQAKLARGALVEQRRALRAVHPPHRRVAVLGRRRHVVCRAEAVAAKRRRVRGRKLNREQKRLGRLSRLIVLRQRDVTLARRQQVLCGKAGAQCSYGISEQRRELGESPWSAS